MDIDILLALQSFRESCPDWVTGIMTTVSSQAFTVVGFLAFCMVYWVADRQAGKRIVFGVSLGLYINGLLKLIFCVNRPWVRDSRITPFGNATSNATGYSFPSGHATYATTIFGGLGIWARKRWKAIAAICFAFVLLVMFSRLYLGVHTPQDVVVGCLSSLAVMWVAYKVEDWTDEDPARDKIVLIAGLVLCAVTAAFFLLKPYPLDYAADGSLIVDPAKMVGDSFQGIGMVAAYCVCRYFERRGFAFDEALDRRERLITGGISIIPLAIWIFFTLKVLKPLIGANLGYFIGFGFIIAYMMIVVPTAMKLVWKRRQAKGAASGE